MAKMPVNKFGKVPVAYIAKRDRWAVSYFFGGQRKRLFFRTEKEAVAEWKRVAADAARYGTQAALYSDADRAEFAEAKRIVGDADLRAVALDWVAMQSSVSQQATVADAVKLFLVQKEDQGRSGRHQATLKSHLERFAASMGRREAHLLSGNEIMAWLGGLGVEPRTLRNYHMSLANFFNWAERRGMVPKSPTASIAEADLPTVPQKAKGVLTVDQAAAMMAWMESNRPHYVACYALQCFAGIRAAEVARVQWNWIDINAKTITLPGWFEVDGKQVQGTKTADDWVLHDLPDNLWAWLKAYKGEGRWRWPASKPTEIIRRELARIPEHAINPWPQNAMRHTFCTMAISMHQSADKVALWSRHTNARQLYKSYVAKLVSKADAERYFSIVPTKKPLG